MQSLVAIGIDVHKDKFALVAVLLVLGAQDQILGEVEVGSDYKEILAFIESIKKKSLPGQTYSFVCGYEAGQPGLCPLSPAHCRWSQVCHHGSYHNALRAGETHQD